MDHVHYVPCVSSPMWYMKSVFHLELMARFNTLLGDPSTPIRPIPLVRRYT